jgi:chromosome segregation ATPase
MISAFLKKKNAIERTTENDIINHTDSEEIDEDSSEYLGASAAVEGRHGSVFANKSHMDKKSLDLIFAVEQIIQAQQRVEASHHETQDRLNYANGQVERLNRDLKNLNTVIEDREKSIMDLEQKLTVKNFKVDQIMEDYRELQSSLTDQIEEQKGIIDVERQKYDSFLQKSNDTQAEKNKRINDLEEKFGKLEIEHAHMKQKFEALRQEKIYLVNIVNDFTTRMTAPFSPKTNSVDETSSE